MDFKIEKISDKIDVLDVKGQVHDCNYDCPNVEIVGWIPGPPPSYIPIPIFATTYNAALTWEA